jgi:hypothetical protein
MVPPVSRDTLRAFTPSAEVSAPVVVDGPCDDVPFFLEAEVLAERFVAGSR